jgi:hypothetical protein
MSSFGDVLVEKVWESDLLDSREDFTLSAGADSYGLAGTTLIVHDGIRVTITYRVEVASDWSTRSATIDIPALARNHRVEVPEPGISVIDGELRTDLDGCTDIDLGWTPATNTIPIRRLGREGRKAATIRAAWLKGPNSTSSPPTRPTPGPTKPVGATRRATSRRHCW